MIEFRVTQGRLLFRNLAQRQTAMVGVLHLPEQLEVIEGAAYLLFVRAGQVSILAQKLDDGVPPEVVGQGIGVALQSTGWRATLDSAAVCVRFCAAWPDANIWTVYGASNHPTELIVGNRSDHVWLDLDAEGSTSPAPPCDPRGETLAQMLTSHPVWPGPHGGLYTLPQHDVAWRSCYLQMSKLHARCGAGEFDITELQRLLRQDPRLNRIRSWGAPDPAYLSYLAALDRANGIEVERPRTVEEHRSRAALAARCIREAGRMRN